MDVDGEHMRSRFSESSRKKNFETRPNPFFERSRTEAFKTPAAKNTYNPFTPSFKRKTTSFQTTVKRSNLTDKPVNNNFRK